MTELSDTDLERVRGGKDNVKATLARADVALDEITLTSRTLRERSAPVLDKAGRLLDNLNRLFPA